MISCCPRIGGSTVHPHTVGNTSAGCGLGVNSFGSSPHPWGTPVARCRTRRMRPVHPHARGEHLDLHARDLLDPGSSPRPWGTRQAGDPGAAGGRLIPTSVGNTQAAMYSSAISCGSSRRLWGTPRLGGRTIQQAGSSPHPWGTPPHGPTVVFHQRFIPTSVGNTSRKDLHALPVAIHPHTCGEHAPIPRRA